jgi:hypothetical protein
MKYKTLNDFKLSYEKGLSDISEQIIDQLWLISK